MEDFKRALKELIPKGAGYLHDRIDDNAHSHLRASLLGASECFPVVRWEARKGDVAADILRRARR